MRTWQRIGLTILSAGGVVAQTQVDLRTQTKMVDFSGAPSTRPVKTGTTLPALCSIGDLFFNTAAAAGANLYACVTVNVWALETGGGTGDGGSLTIEADGTVVGTRPIGNFVTGFGILNTLSDTGAQINIQHAVDTAVILTKASAQSGAPVLCAPTSGSATTFTCSMSPTLTAYTTGMALAWKPDVSGTGSAITLNIDTLGAKPVKLADGTTDPTSVDVIVGRLYNIWYDGAVFRMIAPLPVTGILGAAQPACAAPLRGRLWLAVGATGVKDTLSVCAKDAADSFAWRTLF